MDEVYNVFRRNHQRIPTIQDAVSPPCCRQSPYSVERRMQFVLLHDRVYLQVLNNSVDVAISMRVKY